MKFFKAILMAVLLAIPLFAFALTDDEQIEFMGAVGDGNVKVAQKYLDSGKAKVNDAYFAWTPLLTAASKDQLPMVKMLVEHGADLNFKHVVTKLTPLAYAVYDGNNAMVEYLLQKGADPNLKMKGGVSLVRAARYQGHEDTAKLLMKNGAQDDGCKEEQCY